MSETKFTKGEWEARDGASGAIEIFATLGPDNYKHIANLMPRNWLGEGETDKDRIANAHLISAAPYLYAALTDLLSLVESQAPDGHYTENPSIGKARAALAKAIGEA